MEELIKRVVAFRDERNWGQFHNAKDLAISLNLEAGELLENFQWISSEEATSQKLLNIQDEIADVMIYALLLCHEINIDPQSAIINKLEKNNVKYPVNKSFGSNRKYDQL